MKISLMILLIVSIAALSHLTVARSLAMRGAGRKISRAMAINLPRWGIGVGTMWISIFAAVLVAAFCLGVAAVLMRPAELT